MKFVGITEREGTVTIDGYSSRKSLEAAIKEMGRWIARNIDESEGNALVEYPIESLLKAEDSCGGFFLEAEEVGAASKWDDQTGEMMYLEANWYIICRIVR